MGTFAEPFVIDFEKEFDLGDRLVVEDFFLGQFVPPVLRAEYLVDAVKNILGTITVLDLADLFSFLVGHLDFLDRLDSECVQTLVDRMDLFLQCCLTECRVHPTQVTLLRLIPFN